MERPLMPSRTRVWGLLLLLAAGAAGAVRAAETPEEGRATTAGFDVERYLRFRVGEAEFRFGGRFVADATEYGDPNPRRSRVQLADARPRFSGSFQGLTWRVEADLIGTDTHQYLYEAWAAYEFHRMLRVTAGQFRVSLGSEFASEPRDIPFDGYSFVSWLHGRHDVGARIDGDLIEDILYYEATATAGEGFNLEGRRLESPLYGVRGVLHPFGFWGRKEPALPRFLSGFYLGAGYAWLDNVDDPIIVATPYDMHVVETPSLDARGGNFLHREAGGHWGPFRASYELFDSKARHVLLPGGGRRTMEEIGAWQVTLAWNLTGEEQVFRRGRWMGGPRQPGRAVIPEGWVPGRIEVSFRYSNADIDRDLWNFGVTNYAISTQEVRTVSWFLSWSPVDDPARGKIRLGLGLVKTIADHEIASLGFRNRDTSVRFRVELDL